MKNIELEKRIEDLREEFKNNLLLFERAHKDIKGNISFQNDFVYKFLKEDQIAEKFVDPTKTTGKGKNKKPTISYVPFKYKNILNVSSSDSNVLLDNDYDPFFKFWAEQVIELLTEKNDLLQSYGKDIKLLLGENKIKPIDIFVFFNNKITKIKRRAVIIETLWKQKPSLSQLIRDSKGNENEEKIQYNSIRCYWIDEFGETDRNLYIKIDYIDLEKKTDERKKTVGPKEQPTIKYEVVKFKREFIKILDIFKLSYTLQSDSKSQGICYVGSENKEIKVDLNNIDMYKFLSLVEFEFLLSTFTFIYNS